MSLLPTRAAGSQDQVRAVRRWTRLPRAREAVEVYAGRAYDDPLGRRTLQQQCLACPLRAGQQPVGAREHARAYGRVRMLR